MKDEGRGMKRVRDANAICVAARQRLHEDGPPVLKTGGPFLLDAAEGLTPAESGFSDRLGANARHARR